jgi:hypothetical protein
MVWISVVNTTNKELRTYYEHKYEWKKSYRIAQKDRASFSLFDCIKRKFLQVKYKVLNCHFHSHFAWVIMLFGTYHQSTVLEPRRHQTWNDLGQVTSSCLSLITRTMHTDYVWHTPTLVASQFGWELKWLSGGTLRQAGFLSRATASNSCRKNMGLSKLSLDSILCRKVGYSFFLFLLSLFLICPKSILTFTKC